jgi:hypothetical protein
MTPGLHLALTHLIDVCLKFSGNAANGWMFGSFMPVSKTKTGSVFVVKSNPVSGHVYFEFDAVREQTRISQNMQLGISQEDLADAICMLLDYVDIGYNIKRYHQGPGTPFFLIWPKREISDDDRQKMKEFTWTAE